MMKHRGDHKEKDHHHHHHHLHFFSHHHHHAKEQAQQTVTGERYREVSSSIDEPSSHDAQASSASTFHLKLTVCRLDKLDDDAMLLNFYSFLSSFRLLLLSS